jgi:hypothetical protein
MTTTTKPSHCPCGKPQAAARKQVQHIVGFVGWLVPGAVFAAMPKCPACLAAYIAMASGIGISIPAAGLVRACTLALCIVLLGALSARQIFRLCTKS